MKNTLRLLVLVGFAWLGGLIIQRSIVPHIMLDAVLPQRVMMETTSGERMDIADRLASMYGPSFYSWIGALLVIALSSYALWTANGNDRSGQPNKSEMPTE